MMYLQKTIPYILCWCLCITLAAQTSSRIDSLEQVLASGRVKDSEKAELLKNLANEYTHINAEKSRMYAMEAIRQAQNTGQKNMEASAYIAIANTYFVTDTAKLRMYAMKAFMLAQNNRDMELQEAASCVALGFYYLQTNHYYLSHLYYKRAEKLFLKLNDMERLNAVHNGLLALFNKVDDRENTMYYADKILKHAVGQGNQHLELAAKYNIAEARFKNNLGQEALDYYLDLYHESILLNSFYAYYISWYCAGLYIDLDRPREALPYLHSVRKFYETTESVIDISGIYAYYIEAYSKLNKLDSAEYYLKKIRDIPVVREDVRLELYRIRSVFESAKGDYRNALETYKQYHHLSDSIAKSLKTTEIVHLKNWQELEQKDNENMLLKQERQKQNRLIFVLAGALVMIFVLLLLLIFFFRKTAEKNSELKALHTVKDKLFSVVAHDLRSPIATLMSLLNMANNEMLNAETQHRLFKEISMRVDDTYGLLDNLLCWSKSQMKGMTPAPVYFDVRNEIRGLMDSLQDIAATKKITLNNHIEHQEVYADRDMFAVVLRNLTMNAIKYTSEEGEVTLNSELSDNMLVISVKDTGTGMPQDIQDSLFKLSETKSQRGTRNESGTGLGLVLCADFVKVNGGKIWFISKQDEGSTFYFSIPLKHHQELRP